VLDVGEDIVRQCVLHKGKPPGQLRFARDVALTSYAAYRNIANKAWRWMENMATMEEKTKLSELKLSDQAQHNAMLDLFSAVHNLVVEYLTEVYERARLAHNSSNPADAKVVKPLTNLTEVLQVRFLGQNLAPKLKEVGLDCDSLSKWQGACTSQQPA
jgi:serine/threonine-protein kinase RIO1